MFAIKLSLPVGLKSDDRIRQMTPVRVVVRSLRTPM